MVSAGKLTLRVDARVLSEYHEVLRRPKFNFDQDKVAAILDYIEHHSLVVASVPLAVSLPDADDGPFLEIAISGNASYLVTGNNAHFPSQLCEGVEVGSPAGFLRHVAKPSKRKKSR